jgi:hypothetical protein
VWFEIAIIITSCGGYGNSRLRALWPFWIN